MTMKKSKIAIQGLKGSFHHEAANRFFGEPCALLECQTFKQVAKSVASGVADAGVMAIENSLAGCILPNYNLLRKEAVDVAGEIGLRVKMNVMALSGTKLEDIREAHSHQMALRQCGNFFNDYPEIKIVEAFDTAGSAKKIQENRLQNVAAIASALAAQEYDLEIIKHGVEDHQLNYTRFLVIQKKGESQVNNPNKVSIYFQTSHDPGSLAKALTVISGLGINLGKLQSHPVPSKNSLYGFYATLELTDSQQLNDLKMMMKRMAMEFDILGAYLKGETHG